MPNDLSSKKQQWHAFHRQQNYSQQHPCLALVNMNNSAPVSWPLLYSSATLTLHHLLRRHGTRQSTPDAHT